MHDEEKWCNKFSPPFSLCLSLSLSLCSTVIMLILLAAIFAIHIIGIILLLVATIDNVSPLNWLLYHHTHAGGTGLVNSDTGVGVGG